MKKQKLIPPDKNQCQAKMKVSNFEDTIPAIKLRGHVFECNDEIDILRMFVIKKIPGAKDALKKAEAARISKT
jgi:hypothetical protein